MRLVIQRVSSARVLVNGEEIAGIGEGLVVLAAVREGDGPEEARRLAGKVAALRIFSDEDGKMNRSVLEIGGEVMVVSQFTLYADTSRGNRPSFVQAARPEVAEPLVETFVNELVAMGLIVRAGRFGARMDVHLTNTGPVTILMGD